MSELKPCPFCGSEAKLFADKKTQDWGAICQQPECECNARIPYCSTREEAIEQWNRRAPDPRVAALEEALRKIVDVSAWMGLGGKQITGIAQAALEEEAGEKRT